MAYWLKETFDLTYIKNEQKYNSRYKQKIKNVDYAKIDSDNR